MAIQYSCLGNPMDRRAWQAIVHRVIEESDTTGATRMHMHVPLGKGFPSGSVVKNPPANAGDAGSIPGLGRSPGEGNGNPVFLPGKSHGQRSLAGNSPRGGTESSTTWRLNNYHHHTEKRSRVLT